MKRRSFQGSSRCAASAATVWAVWTNPSEWPGGIVQSTKMDGDFVVGAKIRAKLAGGPATTSTVTRLDPPRFWEGVSKFPGLTMTYEHDIEEVDGGTLLTERAVMSGPFAGIAARVMGKRMEETFVATTRRIAEAAESRPPR